MGNVKKMKYNEVQKVDSIKQMLEMAAKEAGDKIAFKYKDGKKVIEVTLSLGTALASIDMADKHIAIIGENSYKWLTTYLTVLKSTGVFVPIDKELTVKEVINVLKHSESEVFFYAEKYENWIEEISLKEAMKKLNDRERHILNLRFFRGRTQMEVAEEIGISQAQVSRLEKSAIDHMKKYI